MIPRKIHYTWFSNETMPPHIQACIDSWRQHMPHWELVKWDMDAIADINNIFMREAIAKRKWAFAADVVRLYAVYREGGVYLDTDMEIVRPMDDLLTNRAFIGREHAMHIEDQRTEHHLTAHCFGAEAQHPFIGRCLEYYEGRRFVTGTCPDLPLSLRLDMKPMANILSEIGRQWGYSPSALREGVIQHLPDGLTVYPAEYFDPGKHLTPLSYGRHMALGSWRDTQRPQSAGGWRNALGNAVADTLTGLLHRLGYEVIRKN